MPTARLRLSNVCEVGLSTNRIPQLPQSATDSAAWRQPCLSSVMPCTPSTNTALLGTDIAIISITWIALPRLESVGVQNPLIATQVFFCAYIH
jgi:hypothetical protein